MFAAFISWLSPVHLIEVFSFDEIHTDHNIKWIIKTILLKSFVVI